MEMNQVYEAVNGMTKEILGESAVVAEDLSNIVDIGKAVTKERELVLQSMTRLGLVLRLLHSCTHTSASSFPWKGFPLFLQCDFRDLIIRQSLVSLIQAGDSPGTPMGYSLYSRGAEHPTVSQRQGPACFHS